MIRLSVCENGTKIRRKILYHANNGNEDPIMELKTSKRDNTDEEVTEV